MLTQGGLLSSKNYYEIGAVAKVWKELSLIIFKTRTLTTETREVFLEEEKWGAETFLKRVGEWGTRDGVVVMWWEYGNSWENVEFSRRAGRTTSWSVEKGEGLI